MKKLKQEMIEQTNKLSSGDDSNSISFDEFTKYLTGYSYEQLMDAMNKEKERESHDKP
jgi:hypothetical protein